MDCAWCRKKIIGNSIVVVPDRPLRRSWCGGPSETRRAIHWHEACWTAAERFNEDSREKFLEQSRQDLADGLAKLNRGTKS